MRTQPPPARRRGPVAQVCYRVRQFVGARLARVDPVDRAALLRAARVSPTLTALFERMPIAYQWHALNVARRLHAAGHTDPILLQAALLHDMGKWDPATNARVTLFVRSAIVLLGHMPGGGRLLRHLGSGPPPARSLRYAWYLQINHPRLSATLAAQGGARREVIELIREHDRRAPPLPASQRARLAALQAADDES
jgi:hypothetical protein